MAVVDAVGAPTMTSAMTGEVVLKDRQDRTVARRLLARPDFRRLLSVRMFGQFADGVFQASLAGTILFDPERQAHAGDIAAGFAVLLLPYSLLGPFAGVLLDRWSRQRVLLGANLLRALLVCLVAAEISAGVHGQPFYLSALLVISVNRFVLSALSASLPHVVEPEQLVTANAISVTAGAVVTATGGGARDRDPGGVRRTATAATRWSPWAARCSTRWPAGGRSGSPPTNSARTTRPGTTGTRCATCCAAGRRARPHPLAPVRAAGLHW